MDRNLVYPGSIPLDSDLLSINRNTMIALGALAQAVLGAGTYVDGLACAPTTPLSMTITVGPGSISQLQVVDTLPFGSLQSDTNDQLVKMGINLAPTSFTLVAPTASGQAINYLVQATLQESDTSAIVLPYYNAANPAQPYSGPSNTGVAQNTQRIQRVQLQLKSGAPAPIGTQISPPVDNGWVGLYVVSVGYGQATVSAANVTTLPNAPFLSLKLPMLRPGFASGSQGFQSSGGFVVPNNVTAVEVEVWGGGSGSYASVPNVPSGGGAGGGYARKRIAGLTPGQTITVTVGAGGSGGNTAGALPGGGGTSSFGPFVSATGGSLNPLASASYPINGATPGGNGVGGDLNVPGSAGQAGIASTGGLGGGTALGGMQNSGTTGVAGLFPGGGASGSGTGSAGSTAYNGANGANGFVMVRW